MYAALLPQTHLDLGDQADLAIYRACMQRRRELKLAGVVHAKYLHTVALLGAVDSQSAYNRLNTVAGNLYREYARLTCGLKLGGNAVVTIADAKRVWNDAYGGDMDSPEMQARINAEIARLTVGEQNGRSKQRVVANSRVKPTYVRSDPTSAAAVRSKYRLI